MTDPHSARRIREFLLPPRLPVLLGARRRGRSNRSGAGAWVPWTACLAVVVGLGLVAGFVSVGGPLAPATIGHRSSATSIVPTLNGSKQPSVVISGANGSLSLKAALFENVTPNVFQVAATVAWSGCSGNCTLVVGFASQTTTNGNHSVTVASGAGRFFFNLTETEGDYFTGAFYDLSNGTYVTIGTLVPVVVPNSPLTLSFNAQNASVSGVPTTQFGWVMFGAVPPYRLTLTYGDGSWATFTNQTPGYGGCQCGGNVSYHAYPPVNVTTGYLATATVDDSSGLNLTRTIAVQPSYNVVAGTGSGGSTWGNFSAIAANGSAGMYVWGTWVANTNSSCSCPLTLTVNATLRSPSNGSDLEVFSFGDGQSANRTGFGQRFVSGATHVYTSAGTVQLVVLAQDGAGRVLTTSTPLVVPNTSGTGNSGNGTQPPPWKGFRLYAHNGTLSLNVTGAEWLLNSSNPAGGTNYSVLLDANVSIFGGSVPYALYVQFGDGTVWAMNLSGGTAVASHLYSPGGNYTFGVQVQDANGTVVSGGYPISVPFSTSGGGHRSPYPASVSVVVDATPVTGPAPLTVTYSALISGGSAPFTVQWSLPGGNLSSNATGLAASQNYSAAGWYPATAFVYNVTSSYGSVLVGYGSVWVDVTGPVGNASGNGSGHHPVVPPSGGSTRLGAGSNSGQMMDGLLVALVVGSIVGIVVGYGVGKRRGPPRAPRGPVLSREPDRAFP